MHWRSRTYPSGGSLKRSDIANAMFNETSSRMFWVLALFVVVGILSFVYALLFY